MADAIERSSKDLLYFLDTFVYTLDEHDKLAPIKKLPMEKEYLRDLAELFLTEQLLLIEKSRQMLVTWMMCACHLWDVTFSQGRRIFFQSKKEADANANVDRAKFIFNNLPDQVKIRTIYNDSYLKLEFPKQNSIIQGTPQGAAVLRQYTASRIFSDEMAFQEQAEEAFIAAKPTLVGGGSFIGVSSPNFKEFFYLAKSDKIG